MMSVVLGSAFKSFAHENDEVIGEFAKTVHDIFVHSAKMIKLPAKYYMKLKFPAWKHFVKSVDDSVRIGTYCEFTKNKSIFVSKTIRNNKSLNF